MRAAALIAIAACSGEHVAAPDAAACVEQDVPGTIDSCFGTNGMTITSLQARAEIRRVLVLPDQQIVIVGDSDTFNASTLEVLARYEPDGTIDPTFGGAMSQTGLLFVMDAVATTDGGIVVASSDGVQRFTADGALDPNFGNAGVVAIRAVGIRLDPDGGMLVVGGGNGYIDFTRLTPTGAIDPSFPIVHDMTLPSGATAWLASFAQDGSIRVAAMSIGPTAYSVQFTPSFAGTLEQQPVANGTIQPALVGPGVLAGVSIMTTSNPGVYNDVMFATTANGVFQQPQAFVDGGVLLPDGSFTLVGGQSIFHFAPDGEHETDLPWQGVLDAIAVDSRGRYIIAGHTLTDVFVTRYWP